jgi:hypothetical protein
MVTNGRREILTRIMMILEKENRHKTHYDAALKEALEEYFGNKVANQRLSDLHIRSGRGTKSVRRGFKSRGC